ncbi:MAG: TOBE domain-containing protein [Lentisphaerae bacterium]|nr:TOBE domain-containing protein [Lentisphaerota bacterium]
MKVTASRFYNFWEIFVFNAEARCADGEGVAGGVCGFAATVDLTEPLGAETLVHCVTDLRKVNVVVRLTGSSALVASAPVGGDRVLLTPDMSRAVKFPPA